MSTGVVEIKTAVDQIGHAFEEFKASHDLSTKERDGLLEDKIRKLADEITAKHEAVQRELDTIKAEKSKPPVGTLSEKRLGELELFTKHRRIAQQARGGDLTVNPEELDRYEKRFRQYLAFDRHGMSPEEYKDMSIGSDPDGGYFIAPPTVANTIVQRIFEGSPVRQAATVIPIGTKEYEQPEDPGDVGAGWTAERTAPTATTTSTPAKITIPAHEMYALPKTTQQNLEDSFLNIEAYLARKAADKFLRLEGTAFVSGNGVGKPRGFTTYASGTSWGQIEQVGSGSSGAFTYTGLVNIITAIKDVYQRNASWMIRRQSIASIMLLTDGSSRLIFQPILNGNFNETPLLGYPIHYATDMAAIAAGSLSAAFGDFAAGYTIVDRLGVSMLRDNLTDKPNVLFYTRRRVGGAVVDYDAIKLQVLT